MNDANKERFKKAREEREALERKLRFSSGICEIKGGISLATCQEVFDLAWEYGHSYGESEVENYYIDLAKLVKDALIRGQQ